MKVHGANASNGEGASLLSAPLRALLGRLSFMETLRSHAAWEKTGGALGGRMFVRNALLVLLVGGGLATVACSSDPIQDKYPSADSFCAAKADEECKGGAGICQVTEVKCKDARKAYCLSAANTNTGAGRTYRAGQAEACINKVAEVYKALPITAEKEGPLAEACERVFVGVKTKAQTCTSSYDCESSSLICDKGFCQEKVEKNENDGCSNAGEVCKATFACKPEGGQRICRPRQKEGEICDGDRLCLETLRCNGQCVSRKGAGEACKAGEECISGFCSQDGKCSVKLVTESGNCKDFGG
jgi:hypothetical protein